MRSLSLLCFSTLAFLLSTSLRAAQPEDFRLNSSTHRPLNSALDLSTTTVTFATGQIPQSGINGLTTALGTKAAQTAVDALTATVATKAAQAALDSLTYTVSANDSSAVHKTGDESASGNKTFPDSITGPIKDKGGQVFNVLAYGGYNDGTHAAETIAAVIAAESAAAAVGGGTVFFPFGRFLLTGATFYLPNPYITWAGATRGPHYFTSDPVVTSQSTVLLVTNNSSEFLYVAAWGRTFEDLTFVYPNQPPASANPPVVYPYTLRIEVGNCTVRRCTFYNSYDAIRIRSGLYRIEDCLVFGIHNDFYLDRAPDIGWIKDISAGTGFPGSPELTAWMYANRTSFDIRKADGFRLSNIQIGTSHIGIKFAENNTSGDAPYEGSSYGFIDNLDIDGAVYGIYATSTNGAAAGVKITNFNIGTFDAPSPQNAIKVAAPTAGGNAATLTMTNGAVRGTWLANATLSPQTDGGGWLYLSQVRGVGPQPIIAPISTGILNPTLDASGEPALAVNNNAAATPFGSAAFTGLFIVTEGVYTGEVAVFITGGGSTVLVNQTGGSYTTTAGTSGKVNVYISGGVVTIQNKFGFNLAFRVMAFKGL